MVVSTSQDPTPRTVEALYREIAALKEIVASETRAVKDTIATRNEGYDKAIQLLQAKADSMPTPALVQADVDALTKLLENNLKGIQQQFIDLKGNIAQTTDDRKTAIDAAFQAADKAVAERNRSTDLAIEKAEKATKEQIGQLNITLQSVERALKEQLSLVDGRLIRQEERVSSIERGGITQRSDQQTTHGNVMQVVAIVVSVGVAMFVFFGNRLSPPPQFVPAVQSRSLP